jgi:hypothetical protein
MGIPGRDADNTGVKMESFLIMFNGKNWSIKCQYDSNFPLI